ncbi:beta-arabinofuranosyltransferase RAY1 isoform X2 [Impatiens glandulifera]|uniref:beta-arabinofuranosyltransferase RAY1 isoform X2 n=1 Tax=Impatiens glandulifera TaxID=253017 RepID=UPI001FB064D5|nr:beta-arabinofuranosyltransferase RAY1 isoform X2 [Impatiens glandulifera]
MEKSAFPFQVMAKLKLWMIWLLGFILITLSFYTTQRLSSSVSISANHLPAAANPTISIFAAPSPFIGVVGDRQTLAIRSWLSLSPNITVFLFSQDPFLSSFAASTFGSRVSVESNLDFTFLGTPFFHSMVARSQSSKSDVSVLIDPNTILLPNFISALNHAHSKLDHDWLMFSSSRAVSNYPFRLDQDWKHWIGENGKKIRIQELQGFLDLNWKCSNCEDRMVLAWNNCDLPLHNGVLPPFLYGKGLHNRWIINEARLSEYRFVFDATMAISNFYLDHEPEETTWENRVNTHLSGLYGSLYFREANHSNMVKLLNYNSRYVFVDPTKETDYTSMRLFERTRYSQERLSIPFTVETLLPILADENKTIVLAIAGYSYKDLLMSWTCRLRRLMITNFLVYALDDEIYEFSVLQGLPVFRDSLAPTNISFNGCHFGTECFQKVTKVKSRIVLGILKLGYNVLLSDVDVYWFKNPLPYLSSFPPAFLVAQSDEYKKTGAINLPRRLNSGFYFAHCDISTVGALEKVVKHAASSNLSEQPSFYDTLCGEEGCNRIGGDRCLEPDSNLTVHFLDRDLFPNGAYEGLWEEEDVRHVCVEKKGCYVLHNNWINGRRKKLERQLRSGLWDYDMSSRMCLRSWQTAKVASYF